MLPELSVECRSMADFGISIFSCSRSVVCYTVCAVCFGSLNIILSNLVVLDFVFSIYIYCAICVVSNEKPVLELAKFKKVGVL